MNNNRSLQKIVDLGIVLAIFTSLVLLGCGGSGSGGGENSSAPSDITAPTTTVAPAVSDTTDLATSLSVTLNENGTGYYLVQAATAAIPTVAAVQAGTSFAMTANVTTSTLISGLSASTSYMIYFVAKDAANNVQTVLQSVAVTTAAAPLPTGYVAQGGLVWSLPTTTMDTWANGSSYCASKPTGGQYYIWRLPTLAELTALYNSGAMNGQGWTLSATWSSTTNCLFNLSGGGSWCSAAYTAYTTCVY